MNNVILSNYSLDELKSIIAESMTEVLTKFKPSEPETQPDELIKIDKVAEMLNVSKVTIFAWKKQGKLPFYRIANKVYFKKSDIFQALKKIEKRG